jgi:hypothetical protein
VLCSVSVVVGSGAERKEGSIAGIRTIALVAALVACRFAGGKEGREVHYVSSVDILVVLVVASSAETALVSFRILTTTNCWVIGGGIVSGCLLLGI